MPAVTSRMPAVSRTERVTASSQENPAQRSPVAGPGTPASVSAAKPQCAAGMRSIRRQLAGCRNYLPRPPLPIRRSILPRCARVTTGFARAVSERPGCRQQTELGVVRPSETKPAAAAARQITVFRLGPFAFFRKPRPDERARPFRARPGLSWWDAEKGRNLTPRAQTTRLAHCQSAGAPNAGGSRC
jgi:hypothetical protein